MNTKIITLTGASGTGKSSLVRRLLEEALISKDIYVRASYEAFLRI